MEGSFCWGGNGLRHLPSPHPLRDFILRPPPTSRTLEHSVGEVWLFSGTTLTWGCSNINGTVSHSAHEGGKGHWKESKH